MFGEQKKVGGTTEKSGCCCCKGAILFRCAQLGCLCVVMIAEEQWCGLCSFLFVYTYSHGCSSVSSSSQGNSVITMVLGKQIELIVLQCGTQS